MISIQTPNLDTYIDESEHTIFTDELDRSELEQLEAAFDILERAYIILHKISYEHAKVLLDASSSIFDNARDLAHDED